MASRKLYPHASAIGELLRAGTKTQNIWMTLDPAPIRMGTRSILPSLGQYDRTEYGSQNSIMELQRIGAVTIDTSGNIRVHMRSSASVRGQALADSTYPNISR